MSSDKITHAARVWGPVGVLALLITIIYVPALELPFVFDDLPNIVLNPAVLAENPGDLLRVFQTKVSANRPLAMLSFAVNHWLGGLSVFGFHLFNILIHILNATLLYFLLTLLPYRFPAESADSSTDSDKWRLAFWGAALWAVNPVQTQGVTYIVQRMTSMATTFYLAALLVFMAWRRGRLASRWAIPLLLGSFFLGLACKEIVLTLPLALILADLIFFPERFRKNLPIYGGLLLLLILLGFGYLRGNWPDWQATYPNRNFTPLERVLTQWRGVWAYPGIYLLSLPTPPAPDLRNSCLPVTLLTLVHLRRPGGDHGQRDLGPAIAQVLSAGGLGSAVLFPDHGPGSKFHQPGTGLRPSSLSARSLSRPGSLRDSA